MMPGRPTTESKLTLMTPADIEVLEKRFGIVLPSEWKQLVLDYPEELSSIDRFDGSSVAEYEFSNDLDWLLQLNEEVRLEPVIDRHGMAFDWPGSFFVIGDNGVSDYYVIDVDESPAPVRFFDHFECDFEFQAEDSVEFAELIVGQYATDEQLEGFEE